MTGLDVPLVIALIIVIFIDIRAWTSVAYLWHLYREDRVTPPIPTTRLTLTLVKAVVATLTTAGTTYLITLTGTRVLAQAGVIHFDYAAFAMALSPVTLTVFIVILAGTIMSAEYLRWRRRQSAGSRTEYGGSGVPIKHEFDRLDNPNVTSVPEVPSPEVPGSTG